MTVTGGSAQAKSLSLVKSRCGDGLSSHRAGAVSAVSLIGKERAEIVGVKPLAASQVIRDKSRGSILEKPS